MKKIRMRYQVESYNVLLTTPSLLYALFEFFKQKNKFGRCTLTSFVVEEYKDYTLKNLLWERKVQLLTDDEREWLSAVIKPFRDKIFDIEISSDNEDETYISIDVEGDSVSLSYIRNLPFKFKGLKFGKCYTLEELGL